MDERSILIADDDEELCELLQTYLQQEGFRVSSVFTGTDALSAVVDGSFDLLVLDVMLPRLDGFEVLRELRRHSSLPVLMLTAKGDEIDRIVGLELGADDYLAKPCNPRELLARVRAILRRTDTAATPGDRLRVGTLSLNGAAREVCCADQALELTSAEFALLRVLMQRAGQVVGRDVLSRLGLGRALLPYDRSVDVHISNLRKKLAAADAGRDWVSAVRGQGYQLLELPP